MKHAPLTNAALIAAFCLAACKHPVPVSCNTTHTVAFNQAVLPILTSNCNMSGCHNAKDAAEGVILTDYAHIMEIVKAKNPSGSKLYEVLISTGEKRMPRDGSLPADQIATIKLWIEQGALQTDCP